MADSPPPPLPRVIPQYDIFTLLNMSGLNITRPPASTTRSVLEQSFAEDAPAYKTVLADDVKFPITKFGVSSQLNTKCPILYAEFDPEDDVVELPCKHVYTPDAIMAWLKNERAECPVCRAALPSQEVKCAPTSTPTPEPRGTATLNQVLETYVNRIIMMEETAIQEAVYNSFE
jgi:hypothetical protein